VISICLFVPQQMAHICFPRAGQERRAFLRLQSGQADFNIPRQTPSKQSSNHTTTDRMSVIMTGWVFGSSAILSLFEVDYPERDTNYRETIYIALTSSCRRVRMDSCKIRVVRVLRR